MSLYRVRAGVYLMGDLANPETLLGENTRVQRLDRDPPISSRDEFI